MEEEKDRVLEDIKKARDLLMDAIENTNCGYCKVIVSDVVDILNKYNDIVDKAMYMSKVATEEKEFLDEANRRADEMMPRRQEPYTNERPPTLVGGILDNGPLRRRLKSWKQGTERLFDLNIED